jgi:pimeloyl-ACP methyl ester carboxylesterase
MMAVSPRTVAVPIARSALHAQVLGSGPPLVVLHHSLTTATWRSPWDALAADHEVWLVDLPGYGRSERPDWARSVIDLATLLGLWLDATSIQRSKIVGLGFGGWVAAELATLAPQRVGSIVLVGAAGLRPRQGVILDQFLISHVDYAHAYFHDRERYIEVFGETPSTETLLAWDLCREMSARVTWKPYMYDLRLEQLLAATGVEAHVVWGEHDAVVPLECGERYAELLDAPLDVVASCGHAVDLEAPGELEAVIRKLDSEV